MYWSAFIVSKHTTQLRMTVALKHMMLLQWSKVMQSGLKRLWAVCGVRRLWVARHGLRLTFLT